MKRVISFIIGITMLIVSIGGIARAEDLPVKDILRHTDRARGNLGGIVWDIAIVSVGDGAKQSQAMTVK